MTQSVRKITGKELSEDPTSDELVDRARAIASRLRERAQDTMTSRRALPETIDDYHASGLLRMMQPAMYGGLERTHMDLARVIAELAKGCGSSAWVFSVLSAHSLSIASYPKEAQDEVWLTDPRAVASSAFAPTGQASIVDGGYRLTGHWQFASGCDYAQWSVVGAFLEDADPTEAPVVLTFLIPRDDYEIIDDWNVLGLAGTGSKSIATENLFVPNHRVIRQSDALEGAAPGSRIHSGPAYRMPRNATSHFSLAAIPAGLALGAVEEFSDGMRDRASRNHRVAELANIQMRLGEAEAEAETAFDVILRACQACYDADERGEEIDVDLRSKCRRDQSFATKLAVQAVDRLYHATGAHGMYDENYLQRAFRDAHAATQHLFLNTEVGFINRAQIKFGIEPDPGMV